MLNKNIQNQKGVALAEFALVLPFLLLLFLGGVEFTRFVQIHQKLDKANNQIASLVTQLDTVNVADLEAIISVVPKLLEPYSPSTSNHIVSLIGRNGLDPIRVIDQYAAGSGSGASQVGDVGSNVAIPGFTMQPGDEAIVVETYYLYEPFLGDLLEIIGFDLGQEEEGLYKRAVLRPRVGTFGGFN